MDMLFFEWDENKNTINKVKHKVSFEEAETVFYDENAVIIDDPDHSEWEDRFIILGFSARARLFMVCHCYRGGDNIIRIISARKANPMEAQQYDDMEV
ncbi:MAG: BrnT family toxin [Clostridia bacterium]|nr:BrnT family toxin [Clostridia bacterium]